MTGFPIFYFALVILFDYSSNFLTMTDALWPPKPKALESAARTGRAWALLKVKLRL